MSSSAREVSIFGLVKARDCGAREEGGGGKVLTCLWTRQVDELSGRQGVLNRQANPWLPIPPTYCPLEIRQASNPPSNTRLLDVDRSDVVLAAWT